MSYAVLAIALGGLVVIVIVGVIVGIALAGSSRRDDDRQS